MNGPAISVELHRRFDNMRQGLDRDLAGLLPQDPRKLVHELETRQIELERQNDALRRDAGELRVRNEELGTFAYMVAHELLMPVSAIRGFAELLDQIHTSTPAEIEEMAGVIAQNAAAMGAIIHGLLTLVQVRQEDVQAEPLVMAELLNTAQRRVAVLMKEHQAQIFAPADWPVALGNPAWVEEVWANYLSNGIKYGGRPPRIEWGTAPQANGQIRFWVRDNGPGLTPEEQAQLFVPFTRLHKDWAGGHGLGLAIVRRMVVKLGGRAGVESEGIPGQGSTFFFTLPRYR
jgi:two-component system sensor histidine kinase/response regulator